MAHAGGRPLKFKTVKDLTDKADAYFKVTPPRIQTITGLALALDTDRSTLIEYEHKRGDEFSNAIKRYKTMVEHAYELSLRERGSAGDIFGLKNFKWTDKTETDITSGGEKISFNNGVPRPDHE